MEYNGQHIETRQHVFSNKPPWPHILNTNALCAADSAGAGISRSRDPRTPAYPLLLLRCSGIVLNKTYYQCRSRSQSSTTLAPSINVAMFGPNQARHLAHIARPRCNRVEAREAKASR